MAKQSGVTEHPTPYLTLAHTLCLCLGLALLLWGLAPVLVDRILLGRAPQLQSLLLSSVTFLVGLSFIGLHHLIRRDVRWALWAAFGGALLLTTAAIAVAILASRPPSIFCLILAGGTTITSWMTLVGVRERKLPEPE